MRLRVFLMAFALMIFLGGCTILQEKKEDRYEKITSQYPQWDETIRQKVASRKVEIGMTDEMVLAALGEPEDLTHESEGDKWSYAKYEQFNESVRKIPVYFIYLKDRIVVRIEGDPDDLEYLLWYK